MFIYELRNIISKKEDVNNKINEEKLKIEEKEFKKYTLFWSNNFKENVQSVIKYAAEHNFTYAIFEHGIYIKDVAKRWCVENGFKYEYESYYNHYTPIGEDTSYKDSVKISWEK